MADEPIDQKPEDREEAFRIEFNKAIVEIGRKRTVHDHESRAGEGMRDYLGFGLVDAKETVERFVRNSPSPQPWWNSAKDYVAAVLAELPTPSRKKTSAAAMLFKLLGEVLTARGRPIDEELEEFKRLERPVVFARILMKAMLGKDKSADVPNEPPPDHDKRYGPSLPHPSYSHEEFDRLRAFFELAGPIGQTSSGKAGWYLLELLAAGCGQMHRHPDGLIQGVAELLGTIASLLMQYDPTAPDESGHMYGKSREEVEQDLRSLLLAAEEAGFPISDGPLGGVPDPKSPGWCARRVRVALADIDFFDLPAFQDWLAEPAIPDTPDAIAAAFCERWAGVTHNPCPVTKEAATNAIRDLVARLDAKWASADRSEKAKQVVMACMRQAGYRKPSAFFDAERKKAERSAVDDTHG